MPIRPVKPQFRDVPLTPVRKAIAERVLMSAREIPVFSSHVLADATAILEARRRAKAEEDASERPTHNDFVIEAVAKALRVYPKLNAWFENDTARLAEQINLAFAVATEYGVLLPTVFDADRKTIVQIAAESREMIAMARAGKLRASLQQGATFTISNIGPVGIDAFNAIISPPQVGILALGSVSERPAVVGGEIRAMPGMNMTLTVDHRAIDGADAAAFLAEVKRQVEAVEWRSAGDSPQPDER